MSTKNLISNHERSPNELRDMGRKGGIKSGESRRKKVDLQKAARIWISALDDFVKQGGDLRGINKNFRSIQKSREDE